MLDQAHKWWMLRGLPASRSAAGSTVTPFLDLVFVKNIGISYSHVRPGELRGPVHAGGFRRWRRFALWMWLARGATGRLLAVSLGLIIGGAIGNAIDRVALGGVADFFSLHAFGFYWYVFNIADVAIVAGVIGLLYDSLLASRKDAAKPDVVRVCEDPEIQRQSTHQVTNGLAIDMARSLTSRGLARIADARRRSVRGGACGLLRETMSN